MATLIWYNFGPANGLLPDGTKPLREPSLTLHQLDSVTYTRGISVMSVCVTLRHLVIIHPTSMMKKKLQNNRSLDSHNKPTDFGECTTAIGMCIICSCWVYSN